ncbi:hypothetical protein TanjilG_32376, partial [Lupinus angustifolius]
RHVVASPKTTGEVLVPPVRTHPTRSSGGQKKKTELAKRGSPPSPVKAPQRRLTTIGSKEKEKMAVSRRHLQPISDYTEQIALAVSLHYQHEVWSSSLSSRWGCRKERRSSTFSFFFLFQPNPIAV